MIDLEQFLRDKQNRLRQFTRTFGHGGVNEGPSEPGPEWQWTTLWDRPTQKFRLLHNDKGFRFEIAAKLDSDEPSLSKQDVETIVQRIQEFIKDKV